MNKPARLRSLTGILLMLLSLLAHTADPGLQASFTIVETDPQSPAVLQGSDEVYVHFHYVSNQPLSVWVTPFTQGSESPAISSGSPPYPAGEGEGFGWFALQKPGMVDAIHLRAAPAGSGHPSLDAATPVSFTWSGEPGAPRTPAAWVAPFRQREAARQQQAYRDYMARPVGVGSSLLTGLLGLAVLGAVVLCLAWPIRGLLRWQGPWRALSAPPLLLAVLWIINDARDIAADPTAHNLWPFECLEAALLIGAYMLGLSLLRRWVRVE